MEATTASPRAAGSESRAGRVAFFAAMAVGLVLLVPATARLALVVRATPPSQWLVEIPVLADPGADVDPRFTERAEWTAGIISDPALVTARLVPCRADMNAHLEDLDFAGLNAATDACVAILDEALAADPVSGELWLERAKLLLDGAQYGDLLLDSLRKSFQLARHEGWIASDRVPVGIRAYQLLPDDLRSDVREDVRLILTDYRLADPMVRSVLGNATFRETAISIVDQLSPEEKQTFLYLVKRAGQTGIGGT
jgi:hypothetical protein